VRAEPKFGLWPCPFHHLLKLGILAPQLNGPRAAVKPCRNLLVRGLKRCEFLELLQVDFDGLPPCAGAGSSPHLVFFSDLLRRRDNFLASSLAS
jgi:hypothetical protein